MRLNQITDNNVIVEVEPPLMQYNGEMSEGMYVDFEFSDDHTIARWRFPDGRYGGRITEWGRTLTADECLDYCETNYRF